MIASGRKGLRILRPSLEFTKNQRLLVLTFPAPQQPLQVVSCTAPSNRVTIALETVGANVYYFDRFDAQKMAQGAVFVGEVTEWPNVLVSKTCKEPVEILQNKPLSAHHPNCLPGQLAVDADVLKIVAAWSELDDHIKKAILTLVDR